MQSSSLNCSMDLIKERIIKTDEIFNVLLRKNTDIENINGKYKVLLGKYLEKCKHYKKLEEECAALCLNNDEQEVKISKLEEELTISKTEHDNLQSTYVEHLNTSLLQYQSISSELEDTKNKIKERDKQISVLEAALKNRKKKCCSSGKILKAMKHSKQTLEEVVENDSNKEAFDETSKHKIFNQESESNETEHSKFVIEAKTEISSLQSTLSLLRLDNTNLRNDLKNMENICNTLKESNTLLKCSMKEAEKQNGKLQERINALLIEMELQNFNNVEKSETHDIGVQTVSIDIDVDVTGDMINDYCEELIRLPRLISPLEDSLSDAHLLQSHMQINDKLEGISTESPYRESFASPVFCENPSSDIDIHDSPKFEKIQSRISNSSIRSEKLLNTDQLSCKSSAEYLASMQDNDSGESLLVGFIPVSEKNSETKVVQRKKKKVNKRFMKQYSEQIYKKVLNDVLKYLHSNKGTLFNRYTRKRVDHRVKSEKVTRKKPKIVLKKKQKNNITKPNKDNLFQEPYFHYTTPDSVDSGYSAHMSAESECSEILSCKFSESVSELNLQTTEDCDVDNRKLEMFGSDFGSDSETYCSEISNLNCDSELNPLVNGSVTELKRRKLKNSSYNESCILENRNINNNYASTSEEIKLKPSAFAEEGNHQEQVQNQKSEHLQISENSNIEESSNNIKANIITISSRCESDTEKRVFKRPNCRKRVIQTPRSPDPVQEQDILPQKPVIIPLNKPNQLKLATINKLFEKLFTYPDELKILEEVVDKLSNQEPTSIARVIIDVVGSDYHSKVEHKNNPFEPLLTQKQKVLLGFMIKLKKSHTNNTITAFIIECEKRILQEQRIEHIIPLTRLYLAVCKMQQDVYRMRKTCLDALYFMGDLVIPFLYTVLSSWPEVLPTENESYGFILPKVLVQVINLKTCNFPGYNLLNLRTIISKLHGYPSERWNSDELFTNIITIFKENPNRQDAVIAMQILCKNQSSSWVVERLEKLTDSVMSSNTDLLLKQRTVDVLGQIVKQFDITVDTTYIERVKACQRRLAST